VARDLVSFSLGTDTAGSGRIPAGLNELIGLKPSLGLLSTRGVVPACRSLDCVSIFTKTAAEAATVLAAAEGFDGDDPYSRAKGESHWWRPDDFTFGVPRADQLAFFGNDDAVVLFDAALARLEAMGGRRVEIDFAPFLEAALLLYEGPWVA
jgi:allophanate hydrolase